MSAGKARPSVPAPLRLQVFKSVHDLSHPGTKTTAKVVSQRFVWPGVQKDCRTWARARQSCQRCKVSRHIVTPLADFTPPAAYFLHVHIDLVGPLPVSSGYTYCLMAVDHFTHWPEVIPITDMTADTVARALLTGWISHFGCRRPSPRTKDGNLNHNFSNPWPRCVEFSSRRRQPTVPHLTGLWNAFTRH
jgi:cleavage and polyadenylation specificity factor subunit 1